MSSTSLSHPSHRWLADRSPWFRSGWTIVAAFGTYFCMYAFRKPFTAGTYENVSLGDVEYKTVLIVSQVLGYTISKFIGIKVISEMTPAKRAAGILVLIAVAELALVGFALVPPPWNFMLLFVNGLPLGMVFGLVLAYLEGRRVTEMLTAGLCASFIVSSGVVKSVGRALILYPKVSEYWMPALTGLIFAGPLLVFVWMLTRIPPPDELDVIHRTERVPLTRPERWSFFLRYATGLMLLVGVYVVLTVLRSIRDDFAVEIWNDLGKSKVPEIFTQTETIVMLFVVVLNGTAIVIARNRSAFFFSLALFASGFALVAAATALHMAERLGPFAFMVLSGIGLYVPYVAFHTTAFERLIATTRDKSNLGFLMYVADAIGYLGYVAVLLVHDFGGKRARMLDFFHTASMTASAVAIVAVVAAGAYFSLRLPTEEPAPREA